LKQFITVTDIDSALLRKDKTIVINPQDVITSAAGDYAKSKGITFIVAAESSLAPITPAFTPPIMSEAAHIQKGNQLKAKLQDGGKVIGTMFQLGCPTVVECLGISGLDFFIIDTEHSPVSVESTRQFIMAAELRRITPLVRIKRITRDIILNALDIGAGGLIAPGIETAAQVREMINYAKYPQEGSRGFSLTRTSAFGYDEYSHNPTKYFKHCNDETLIIPQCETKACLENIDEIAAIPGVDGIFIGPYDLSVSLGCPAEFDTPKFTLALKRVLDSCQREGKFVFMLAKSVEQSKNLFENGYSGIVYNSDIDMFISAYKSVLDQLRGTLK
jgi:4-hydroxy-2-oxoheptanedioate aldolase